MYCNAIHANTHKMYLHVLWYVLVVCIEYIPATYQHVFNTNRYVFNTYLSVLVCIVLVLRMY